MGQQIFDPETETLSGEVDINEDCAYDTLILNGSGCLNIGGLPDPGVSEINITIGTLIVDKTELADPSYEFKCTSPSSGKMSITIEIENLQNDIRVLRYAPDGKRGSNGNPGGNGGDGLLGSGGMGGAGSDGQDGEDGRDCPDVLIRYHSSTGSHIAHSCILSQGGEGGTGGNGGLGGLSSEGAFHAPSGFPGRNGRKGRPGGGGSMTIIEVKENV